MRTSMVTDVEPPKAGLVYAQLESFSVGVIRNREYHLGHTYRHI